MALAFTLFRQNHITNHPGVRRGIKNWWPEEIRVAFTKAALCELDVWVVSVGLVLSASNLDLDAGLAAPRLPAR